MTTFRNKAGPGTGSNSRSGVYNLSLGDINDINMKLC